MTANEMAYEFNVLYDKITSLDSPGYSAKEISTFLTKAQEVYIDNFYTKEYAETIRRDFDNLAENIDITNQSSNQNTGKPNGVRYDLPSDTMYILAEETTIVHPKTCFNGNRILVIPKTKDEYGIQINNPHKKPLVSGSPYDCAWRLDFNNDINGVKRVELITDGIYTINTYHLNYLRKPVDIVPLLPNDTTTSTQVDCELNFTAHRQIVDIAVRIATGDTNPKEYNLKLNEEKLNN